jgi:hypothetical protein
MNNLVALFSGVAEIENDGSWHSAQTRLQAVVVENSRSHQQPQSLQLNCKTASQLASELSCFRAKADISWLASVDTLAPGNVRHF